MNIPQHVLFQGKILSRYGFASLICIVILTCTFLVWSIYHQSTITLAAATASYRHESYNQTMHVKDTVETLFKQIYQNIGIISRLPSVRMIDRHAKTLSKNDKITIQEIYNNLKNNVDVSDSLSATRMRSYQG